MKTGILNKRIGHCISIQQNLKKATYLKGRKINFASSKYPSTANFG